MVLGVLMLKHFREVKKQYLRWIGQMPGSSGTDKAIL